jgi:hypothetical protein
LSNIILYQSNTMKFKCTSSICDLTYLFEPASAVVNDSTSYSLNYNNATRTLITTWNDPLNTITSFTSIVSRENMLGNTTICDNKTYTTSGAHTCYFGTQPGNYKVSVYFARGSIIIYKDSKWYNIPGQRLGDFVDKKEAAFWSFGIFLTITSMGLFSPVLAVLCSVFAIIVIAYLGLFPALTTTFILIAGVLAVIIGFKVKQ